MAQKTEAKGVTNGAVVLGMSVSRPPSGRFHDSAAYKSVFRHVQWQHLAAGVSGGVVATLILHPLDLVKVRFQVNEGLNIAQRPQYTGLINAISSIVKQHGVRGLYQGVTPNVWGAGASWGLYFLFCCITMLGGYTFSISMSGAGRLGPRQLLCYNAMKSRWRNGDSEVVLAAQVHMALAAQSGLMTLALTNPLWVAKTRLCLQYDQTASAKTFSKSDLKHYRGLVDCLHKTYKSEGFRGLYKGFVPGIFGVSHGALQFMAYEELKKVYNSYRQRSQNTKLGTTEYLCFAAISKIFAASITYPYQVVRSRLQDQHRSYNGAVDVITQTYRNEGTRGFYKGLVPGVLKVTPACCITFVVYEHMITFLQQHSAKVAASQNEKDT